MATFGNTNSGTGWQAIGPNQKRGSHFTCPSDMGTVVSISAYCNRTGGGNGYAVDCAIYTDSSGAPNALVANSVVNLSSNISKNSPQWYTGTYGTPPSLTGGNVYWLTVLFTKSGNIGVDSGSTNDQADRVDTLPFDDPFGTPGYLSILLEIYVTYTPSGTTYTKTVSLDAFLKKIFTKTLSLDALLNKAGLTKSTSLDAYLQQAGIEKTLALDAFLQQIFGKAVSLDALLNATGLTRDVSLDALLNLVGQSKTVSLDAILIPTMTTYTLDVSLDALLRAIGLINTVSLDALLQRLDNTKSLSLDAYTQKEFAATASLDALLLGTQSKGVALDAILEAAGGPTPGSEFITMRRRRRMAA